MTTFRHVHSGGSVPLAALADAAPEPYWLDIHAAPEPRSALTTAVRADLVIIGGGYTGLWAALQAKEADPGLDVLLLEADVCGNAASGRNGGFCSSSLTHGIRNGFERFAEEMPAIVAQGLANLDAIEHTVADYHIECDFRRTGEFQVATEQWQAEELIAESELAELLGHRTRLLSAAEIRAEVHSPTYLGALELPGSVAMLDPMALALGLRRACLENGVRIHEWTAAVNVTENATSIEVITPYGKVNAKHAILATNGFPPLLRRLRNYVVPVYDYVLVTEPLSDAQRESIGWDGPQGISDSANQFHYYRRTADGRILWGGYDAIYYYGGQVRSELNLRANTYATLARNFFTTFPQLEGVKFTHRWGGMIDTCTRFCPFIGTAMDGRLGYALGFTGLGVGASRFAAGALVDKLYRRDTERAGLRLMNSKPVPLPPEPLRWLGIQLTRWSLDRADHHEGKRNLWLRALDAAGMGFGS